MSAASLHGVLYASLRVVPEQVSKLDEGELLATYPASRSTVRRALSLLADEGLVTRAPSRGTRRNGHLQTIPLYSADIPTDIVVHETAFYSLAASPVTDRLLGVASEPVKVIEATVTVSGDPLFARTTMYKDELRQPEKVTTAVEGEKADIKTAEALGVPAGTGLLVKTSVSRDASGEPFRVDITHYAAHRVALHAVSGFQNPSINALDEERPAPDKQQRRDSTLLYRELRTAIRLGLIGVRERIDAQQLGKTYDVSRSVLQSALDRLVEDGLLDRARRRGTHLQHGIKEYSLSQESQFNVPRRRPGNRADFLQATRIHAPEFAGKILDCKGQQVDVLEYIYWYEDRPLNYIRYLPASDNYRPIIGDHIKDFNDAFRNTYSTDLGRHEITASLMKADPHVAERLGVQKGELLLLKERLSVGADGMPREYTHTYYPAASSAFVLSGSCLTSSV